MTSRTTRLSTTFQQPTKAQHPRLATLALPLSQLPALLPLLHPVTSAPHLSRRTNIVGGKGMRSPTRSSTKMTRWPPNHLFIPAPTRLLQKPPPKVLLTQPLSNVGSRPVRMPSTTLQRSESRPQSQHPHSLCPVCQPDRRHQQLSQLAERHGERLKRHVWPSKTMTSPTET